MFNSIGKAIVMNKKHPADTTSESVSQAYESTLEEALQRTAQTDSDFHHLLEIVSDDIKLASQLKADEIVDLKNSIMRDLLDAAHHMNETGKELKDWLGFDLMLIKNELWKSFTEATDKTTLELQKLKYIAENAEYHTGEIIGLGTLICDQCKAVLHFHQPGHIPPCGKCHGTRFHRQHRDT
jgi:hypothetical protein